MKKTHLRVGGFRFLKMELLSAFVILFLFLDQDKNPTNNASQWDLVFRRGLDGSGRNWITCAGDGIVSQLWAAGRTIQFLASFCSTGSQGVIATLMTDPLKAQLCNASPPTAFYFILQSTGLRQPCLSPVPFSLLMALLFYFGNLISPFLTHIHIDILS